MKLLECSEELKKDRDVVIAAVKNKSWALQFIDKELQDDKEILSYVVKDDEYYYNIKNPATGLRYIIPMLSIYDPRYVFKYIDYMKMKEQNEETFQKMLNWD